MKYFIDTEFHEGFHKPLFGRNRHFIDFISIGIVSEDGREYYAVSKDFDIKAAWNSYQMKQVSGDARNIYPEGVKEYWLRENVLKNIAMDLHYREYRENPNEIKQEYWNILDKLPADEQVRTYEKMQYGDWFSFREFKRIINKYGKTNKQIAEEVKSFVQREYKFIDLADVRKYAATQNISVEEALEVYKTKPIGDVEFYGYYADYDWVVFCSLFGKMIDLPKGFPKYCRDLKQWFDFQQKRSIHDIKKYPAYPTQINEHNALSDARWNKQLFDFLRTEDIDI